MTAFATTVSKLKPEKIELLKEGQIGSRLVTYPNGIQAIMKIASPATNKKGREFQHGLPTKSFPKREVAFFALCKVLREYDSKFDVIPETVLGEFKGWPASFQQYATAAKLYELDPRLTQTANKEMWAIALRETLRDLLPGSDILALTVLDFLACSRDRHAANYGARLDISSGKARWRVIGWDNGCSFGLTQAKYRCVAHKHLFRFAMDLAPVWGAIQKVKRSEFVNAQTGLLSDEEIDHEWMRVQFMNIFPHRMPWTTLSQGHDDADSFPAYANFFQPMADIAKPLYIMNSV